jgi:RNA polymerase sigma-70 factor (ECF subfamily)
VRAKLSLFVGPVSAPSADVTEVAQQGPADVRERDARLARLAREHFGFIWRSLRRLGVPEPGVDDAAQRVFEVAARRRADLEPGREKAFLFKTALFVAIEARREAARARDQMSGTDLDTLHDAGPSPEDAALISEKRLLLDRILATLEFDERTVFVLYELEELELGEIAKLVGIPRGTAASRLRRARESFQAEVNRLRARLDFPRRYHA